MVLTLSFGSGHIRAAQSIVGELHRREPKADIRMVDALENCSLLFRAFYVWTYWAMIRYAPRLWKKFFQARLNRKDENTAPIWAWRKGCWEIFSEIRIFQPDVIVACEVGASEIAVIASRFRLTNAEIINVITDFEAEPIWIKPEISLFAVATEEVRNQLTNWGADDEKISVCGIPLNEGFRRKHDSLKIRNRYKLDNRPVVLLMGGGMGPARMDKVAALLLKNGRNLQIIALPGSNKKTLARLEKLQNTATVSLRFFTWTDEVAALMQISSVLVTKPGGLTLAEAAACGVPLVLFDAIPGPEEANATLFITANAAIMTQSSEETASRVLNLLQQNGVLKEMSANIKKLAQPKATEKIADLVLEKFERLPETERIQFKAKKLSVFRKAFGAVRKLTRQRKTKLQRTEKPKVSIVKIVTNIETK